jgi:phosphinothricin acetyltransferase
MIVRDADTTDLEAMRAVYADAVWNGTGTFEEVAPDAADYAARFQAVRGFGLPWLVAEQAGALAGFGYVAPYRPRSGYRFTVEDSVYVAPGAARRGVGRALLEALIARCEALGLRRLVASIGDSGNTASIALHRACGFEIAGVLPAVGFKHGRWLDVVFMQRALNTGDSTPPEGPGWAVRPER